MKNILLIIATALFISVSNYSFSFGGGGGGVVIDAGSPGDGSFVPPPSGMPDCSLEDPPGNTACAATPICNLNGYCGTTSASYTADYWSQLNSGFCGSIENNAFLSFTANQNSISFDVYVYNCGNDKAIQIYLFKADNCGSGPVESVICVNSMYAQNTPYNVSASGLIPGDQYYIMIDGFAGHVCDYTFVATDGVATPIDAEGINVNIVNDNFTICSGESVEVLAGGGLGNYEWSGDAGLSTTTGNQVTITPPTNPGVYNYNIESSGTVGLCLGMTSYDFTITVDDCGCADAPNILVNDLPICAGESVDLADAIDPSSDPVTPTYHSSHTDAEDGLSPVTGTNISTAGSYWIRVEDPADPDCYAIHQVDVEVTTLDFTSTTVDETCGDGNGEIALTVTSGTAPYSFSIDNGTTSQVDDGDFDNLSGGTYDILIIDDNGCETTGTVDVNSIGTPQVSAPSAMDICVGESVTLTADNPDNATISWDNGVTDGVSFEPAAGIMVYTVTATANGCTATDQVIVNVHENPIPEFEADILKGCSPLAVEFTSNAISSDECLWDFGNGETSTDCGPVSHVYTTAGEFTVTLTVTSVHGCEGEEVMTDYIEVINPPIASFIADPMVTKIPDTEVDFTNESINANDYLWDFGDGSNFAADEDPSHIFPGTEPGSYLVTLYASNDECGDSSSLTIIIEHPLISYEVPNIFTPNGDGSNDFFHLIDPTNIKTIEVVILNRWGNLVFESDDPNFHWNGKINNSGTDCHDGVYFYKMKLTDHSDVEYDEHGYVHLNR